MWNRLSCILHNLSLLIYIFKYIFTMQTFSLFLYKYICVRVMEKWPVFKVRLCGEIQYKIDLHFFVLENRNPPSAATLSRQVICFPFFSFFFCLFALLFPWFLKYSSDWFLCLFAQVLNIKSQIAKTTKGTSKQHREQHTRHDRSLQTVF